MSPLEPSIRTEVLAVHRAYLWLAQGLDPDAGMGGKLLYAAELDEAGRRMVRAANIAGAASLSATLDPTSQKRSIREGVVDFFVTNLDEALRILKNEVRKRQPVSVGVGVTPETLETEMEERGVLPDLRRPAVGASDSSYSADPRQDFERDAVLVEWSVASAPALWLPKIDAIALGCLPSDAIALRRWLHLAPRYLGRPASSFRVVRTGTGFATSFVQRLHEAADAGALEVAAHIAVTSASGTGVHQIGH